MDLRFMSDPPTLSILNKTHKINVSDTLEITCRGHQILAWYMPHNRTGSEGRLTVSDCSGHGLFCSTLTLTAAMANETGEYRCSYRDLPVEEGKTSVMVYVFVQGQLLCVSEYIHVQMQHHGTVTSTMWWNFGVCVEFMREQHPSPFPCSLGYKIYDLTVSPAQEKLTAGEKLVLNCTAHTELNVAINFQWTLPQVWRCITNVCTDLSSCYNGVSVNGHLISSEAYRMRSAKDSLTIFEVTERDAGNYTVVLTNRMTREEQKQTFQLLVNAHPKIFEKEVPLDRNIHMFGSSPMLTCTAFGGSSPVSIKWQWMPSEDCPIRFQLRADQNSECEDKWRDISNNTGKNPINQPTSFTDHSLKTVSTLKIQKAVTHALFRCIATNKVGVEERVIIFQVTRNVFPSSRPIEGEDVHLSCVVDRMLYSNLSWYRVLNVSKPHELPAFVPCGTLALTPLNQPNSTIVKVSGPNATLDLHLPQASRRDQGLYACRVENADNSERTCLLHHLQLRALEAPWIVNNLTEQRVNMSDSTTLVCDVSGTPTPVITWTKDNQTVMKGSGVILTESNRTLTIQRVKKEDSGMYICTACNKLGCDSSKMHLTVEGECLGSELIVPIGAVVIAMFFWLLVVFVIRNRKRPNDGEMKTGYLSIILDSEDMPMDEHCERLTYDASKWEFPRERLKLGDPLGRGAFGQVVEAAAFGIEKTATCTTVAVKMLKEGATSSEYRALMSELKILIHIGHHLNVVNLLGACTKPGGPLMVIVEYCKHGNLSSYLKLKRGEYSPYKLSGSPNLRRRSEVATTPIAELVMNLCCVESSDWDHLTMEDLIRYSFQVAKGMEFLSSRKCIHRDLAARNILLSENNIVKICDFGLARDVYKDPDYVRKGDARLPLKWMAPETIFDRVYTTQSDVWSFGVLLWEIFSLGASPYPGVNIDESFCRSLKEGTRMRPPDYATPEIYQTMLDCWQDQSTDRPTFTELVEHLGNLLQASAQQVCVCVCVCVSSGLGEFKNVFCYRLLMNY
uniref:receptor protein-tyrosine kinase n=1 Tax=Electrophorus electricus TaxID=8005 RepID=A0A4W4GYQ2_ELEEL